MKKFKVKKTFEEINAKIKEGRAVVVTAEEMIDIVERNGAVEAARKIDVVTTGILELCAHRELSLILVILLPGFEPPGSG
jgi:uncharacterized protein (DUF39 family)